MFKEFRGKVILVTGAGTGIGSAVARAFGGFGAKVGVHYNSHLVEAEAVAADILSAGGEAFVVKADPAALTPRPSLENLPLIGRQLDFEPYQSLKKAVSATGGSAEISIEPW